MKIEIYTKPSCSFCIRAKDIFKKNNLEFTEYEVGPLHPKEEILDRIKNENLNVVIKTVPQIFIDNKYVGGHDELVRQFSWAR
jgi:glutaredoxin 3